MERKSLSEAYKRREAVHNLIQANQNSSESAIHKAQKQLVSGTLSGHDEIQLAMRQIALQRLAELRKQRQRYNWLENAREEQLPPDGDWAVWVFKGGRGSGKTRAGAEWVRMKIEQGFRRGGIIGQTSGDVRDVCIEGESGLLAVCPPSWKVRYESSRRRVVFPKHKAVVHVYSADDPARFRGPQHEFVWADEFVYYPNPSELWETMMMGLRLGPHPQVMATSTPLPIKLMRELIERDGQDVVVTTGTTYANLDNLAPTFRRQVLANFEGTHRAKSEILGELIFEVEGALWSSKTIQQVPADKLPEMKRIVIAVDPSIKNNAASDEAGIIVAGLGVDDLAYVMADWSIKATPEQWARRAVQAYHAYEADRIVIESNQGGDMVKTTLHSADPTVPVKMVHAYRGKMLRAEPISAKYEQGHVVHVTGLDQLEAEMCTFDGTGRSPNRLDAMVYAIKELIVKGTNTIEWRVY